MFSTYCPTCDSQVLLGTRRIVSFPGRGGPEAVLLRCTCGTIVPGASTKPEAAPVEATSAPSEAPTPLAPAC
jgi:hypothetical protein